MNALAYVESATARHSTRGTALLGLRPFVHKELREWLRSRRAVSLLLVSTSMMLLNTLGPKIGEFAARSTGEPIPSGVSFDATTNVLVRWPQWIYFFAIIFSVSLLIAERDRGTLAWSLSKPLSRTSLLVGKWLAAMIMYSVFGIALPMLASVIAAAFAYGMPDVGQVIVATALLTATPAFFIALTLAFSTILPSQPPVAGVAIGVALAPVILGSFLPAIVDWFPTTISFWAIGVAMGGSASVVTPVSWAVGMIVVTAFGVARLRAADL